jgi:hypothetical protein
MTTSTELAALDRQLREAFDAVTRRRRGSTLKRYLLNDLHHAEEVLQAAKRTLERIRNHAEAPR